MNHGNLLNKTQQKIYAIFQTLLSYASKLRISSFVGGQFKERQTSNNQNIVGHLGMRTIPMHSENAERCLKRSKEKTMTFIISGISNKKPFLMSDCVGIDNSSGLRKFNYKIKLNKLISPDEETYFCLAGNDSYDYAVSLFDRECYEKNKSFNFRIEEHMYNVMDIFREIKEYRIKQGFTVDNYARLYFINKTNIYYFDIEDDGILSKIQEIGLDNYYIRPNITRNAPIKLERQFENNQELINFCKEEISKVQDYNINLQDKFSFVIFDNEEVLFDNSVKTNKELVLSLIGGSYIKLK